MKQLVIFVFGVFCIVSLSGCATMRPESSLENRVQILESKVQNLEGASSSSLSETMVDMMSEKPGQSVTAETMSKKEIQKALKNAGYYNGSVDGKIGPKTRGAIVEFQQNMDLKADGIAGKNTKEKLLKYLE